MKLIRLTLPLALATSVMAQIPEPDVVFYGRVLHQGGGEDYLMTRGQLEWRVDLGAGPSASPAFQTSVALSPMKNAAYSYQLRVPQRLAVSGLRLTEDLPGLPVADKPYQNTEIKVNGHTAKFLDPTSRSFASSRGAFRRLDLAVGGPLPDSDGDGLPDWWESKYGLDPKTANANGDPDGDKANNLAEYRAGTDPSGSDQSPRLPEEIWLSLPLGGRAAPYIHPLDRDSTPDNLTYSLGDIPEGLRFSVLPGAATGEGPRVLESGQSFTQAELEAGAVVVEDLQGRTQTHEVLLTLRDETLGHSRAFSVLNVSVAELDAVWASWQLPSSAKPEAKAVFHDASRAAVGATLRAPSGPIELEETLLASDYLAHVNVHGPDARRVMLGSSVADVLLGSGEADLLILGDGDTARGYAGADRFLAPTKGRVTITDFASSERDTLDLRAALTSTPGRPLSAYLSLVGGELRLDANGDGSGYTDLTISLPGAVFPTSDLAEHWDQGLIETGDIAPRLTLFAAVKDQAAEEGQKPGHFILRRRGDTKEPLTVPLTWSGTATSGRDFEALPSQAQFAAGQKTLEIAVRPMPDDEREPAETIQLTLAQNAAYDLADGGRASMSLIDVPTRVWLEVAEGVAYQDSLSPAQILLRRSGPLATPLTVTLQTSGRATAGIDYRRLPGAVTFPATQETLPLEIMPLATGVLSKGCEDVTLSIRPDSAYEVGASTSARIRLCQRPRNLADWLASKGSASLDAEEFLADDSDRDGLSGLVEFAFDLSPTHKQDALPVRIIRDAKGNIGLEFSRWPDVPGLQYRVEISPDLRTWREIETAKLNETILEMGTNGQERIRVLPESSTSAAYFRVNVNQN